MHRRQFITSGFSALTASILLIHNQALALSLQDLSNTDASKGIKSALEIGALSAVKTLGKTDGFLGNPKVRIPLPGFLESASKLLKTLGQSKQVDELVKAMNRAAEVAVPLSKDLLVNAIRSMSISDAKNILTGGDTSITKFFAEKTRAPLNVKFLPIVTQATQKVRLAEKYNQLANKATQFGLVKTQDANIQQYVTTKSLDGLYLMIGEEEKKIRQNPMGTGSAILQKVFGALK